MANLPDHLALPLVSGAGSWLWSGGRPATDLVNTLRERAGRRIETLVTPADLVGWLNAARVLADPGAPCDARRLDGARRLREAIDACVAATVERNPAPACSVQVIDAVLSRPALIATDIGAPLLIDGDEGDPVRAALATVALDAARMLGTVERDRIRICAGVSCSARFYDRSPGGRRRWCSGQSCGNSARVRAHRARRTRTEEALR